MGVDVTYPQHDIELTDEIHIPVDTPIDIHVTSADDHGFWVLTARRKD